MIDGREMSLDDWDEKSGKKNDYEEVDGMKQKTSVPHQTL